MAAAKKRGWRTGRRSVATRPVQMTRHLIVCEGTQTEPLYFEGMKAALGDANGKKLAVVVRGTGRHTLDLLDYAQELCRYAADTYGHVWLAFDKDDFPSADFDAMEHKCSELSDSSRAFHALWSNPCFELWLLLHLRYTTATMGAGECQRALLQAMSRELGIDYRKNLAGIYDVLDGCRNDAVKGAMRLAVHHEELGNVRPSRQNPATKVGDIFKEIGPYLRNG